MAGSSRAVPHAAFPTGKGSILRALSRRERVWVRAIFAKFRIPETIDEVIVDQAHRLHKGIANGRADESEAAPLQVFAQGVRFGGSSRNLLRRAPSILARSAVDEAPDIGVEAAE